MDSIVAASLFLRSGLCQRAPLQSTSVPTIEFRMQVARWLHLLGVVVWIGGMFFAHFALRPAAAALPPPQRLPLLAATLRHFFGWVGAAIVAIVGSGTWLVVAMGGAAATGTSVRAMAALGIVMVLVFAYIVLGPYAALRRAVTAADWPAGGAAMAMIRRLVGVNLALGVVTLSIATLGR
jgi:uncharacterized membrane protein